MPKTTVALTPDSTAASQQLDSFNMPEKADLVRLGFAYAVTQGFDLGRPDNFGVPGSKDNYTANTGTLDPDRRIERLVVALYGDLDEPYYAVETLANKGLLAITEALKSGEIGSISDILPELGPLS
ncbi:MAG: hypothetical protein OXN80_09180 [bacterium]|nr:hypothetical protein [bacterium]